VTQNQGLSHSGQAHFQEDIEQRFLRPVYEDEDLIFEAQSHEFSKIE
jgi:hypothetical protein